MTHTWELHLSYHDCPHCGRILENRNGKKMQATCPYCKNSFTIEPKKSPKPEFDWS